MSQGYRFAGTQASNWCFCADKYDTLGSATNCNLKCVGNSNQICGGHWANSVYEVRASGELNIPFAVGNEDSDIFYYVLFQTQHCNTS